MFARVRAAISDAWRCRRVRRRVPQFVSTLPIFNRLDEEARLTERAEQVIETNTQIEISSELDTPSRISRPRYKWPSRKRSRSESAGSEDQDIPTRTPKRPRFLPPHRGYLLSPIGEESETPRKAASEPSEGYLSDPMDLDGDSFNADVARVNAGLYEPLPGDSNPQLKPSKKRKSLAQDGDATYLPERPGCQDAVGVTPSDDSDFEIPVPPRKRRGIVSEFEREKARRLEIVRDRHDDSWGEAEKRLDSRLGMLGFEPLMPKHWHFDFRTLPVSVFGVPEAGSEPVIRASGGSDFRGMSSCFITEKVALVANISLSSRQVSDRTVRGRWQGEGLQSPEPSVRDCHQAWHSELPEVGDPRRWCACHSRYHPRMCHLLPAEGRVHTECAGEA